MNLLVDDPMKPKSLNWGKYLILLVCVTLIVGGYWYIVNVLPPKQVQNNSVVVTDTSIPTGTLFMSLTTVATTTGNWDMFPSVYDITSKTSYEVLITHLATDEVITFQHNFSANGEWITSLALTKPEITDGRPFESWSVLKADLRGSSGFVPMLEAIQASSTVYTPNTEDYFRESPVINDEGAILYSSLSASSYEEVTGKVENLNADSWSIYLVDTNGIVAKITDGLRPKWIDTDSFAYLKNDGVYVFDIKTKRETLVMSSVPSLTVVNGLDVSDDGQLLVLTSPVEGKVAVLDISSGLTDATIEPFMVSAIASNPLFSPDNQYIALVMPVDEVSGDTKTQLRFYSLITRNFLEFSDEFEEGTIDGIYMTDWRSLDLNLN